MQTRDLFQDPQASLPCGQQKIFLKNTVTHVD